MLQHKFYLVRDLSAVGEAVRVVGYFSMNHVSVMLRLGIPSAVVRVCDGVVMATTGRNAYGLVTWIKDNPDLAQWLVNPLENALENAMSKLASQEKVTSFDPPVRTGDTQTQAETLVPTGNISHFELFRKYNGREWLSQYAIMKRQGYTFTNGGFSTRNCEHCGGNFVVGMDVYFDGLETSFWIEACAGCGHARQERAVYEMVVSNV